MLTDAAQRFRESGWKRAGRIAPSTRKIRADRATSDIRRLNMVLRALLDIGAARGVLRISLTGFGTSAPEAYVRRLAL